VITESTGAPQHAPSFGATCRFWLNLGLISFGGPSGQIAIMHAELVEKKRWIDEGRFLHALNFCMLLPGPEATQLATYCGWLLHGTAGGVVAGTLFILPSALLLWGLSLTYVVYGNAAWLTAVFAGIKPAVIAIVALAVWRIGRRALKTPSLWLIAAGAFSALFFFHAPFPAVIAVAAAVGLMLKSTPSKQDATPSVAITTAHGPGHNAIVSLLRILACCLVLWWTPVIVAGLWLGWNSTLPQQGLFFSKAALVTFGGAYAVLPYVGQQAVEHFGWLSTPQMLDGLGLAETTPGPLIMVLQFVGFVGAWQHPGALGPLAAATLGAAMTTWVTFVPSFLFIFAGAPYIERLRTVDWLSRSLTAVTAAVVGVILNLAVWFGLHVISPRPGDIDWFSAGMTAAASLALIRFRLNVVAVVLLCAFAGVARGWIG
jgi:chromate transporter